MAQLPFQLSIERSSAGKGIEILTCTALLRKVPGKREVYDALWNGRSVIVKMFSHKIRAGRHLKKEWHGLNLLRKREINSPVPLFYGKADKGKQAMVVEKIIDASTVLDVFKQTKNDVQKLGLLILVSKELAKQNAKGILQEDLHLGNFLLKEEKIFTIDPAQMRFLAGAAGKKKSISQIAWLACFLPENQTEAITKLWKEYLGARDWQFNNSDTKLFEKQLKQHRKKNIRRGLKKCQRTSGRYLKINTCGFAALFERRFCEGAKPLDFIKSIDEMMDGGEIFKRGNTCYVSRIRWNGNDIVVKRYNHKGIIHSLRHTIKRSRARSVWLKAHRLLMLNMSTAKPVCYIEKRRWSLVWTSYFVTEYVQGQNLHNFLQTDSIGEQQQARVIGQVTELLEKLGKYRISHGDTKCSNFLITENGPVIIDLDAMKVHSWGLAYKYYLAKDMEHFKDKLRCISPSCQSDS